jgi:hypothetical protein
MSQFYFLVVRESGLIQNHDATRRKRSAKVNKFDEDIPAARNDRSLFFREFEAVDCAVSIFTGESSEREVFGLFKRVDFLEIFETVYDLTDGGFQIVEANRHSSPTFVAIKTHLQFG